MLFRIECFLLISGIIKVPLASVLYICRGMGAIIGWRRRVTGVFGILPALLIFLCGVLILSRKILAWCLQEILFHSPFFPIHRPSTNFVLVPATKKLTDSLTVIRYRKLKAAKENHEIENDFQPTLLT